MRLSRGRGEHHDGCSLQRFKEANWSFLRKSSYLGVVCYFVLSSLFPSRSSRSRRWLRVPQLDCPLGAELYPNGSPGTSVPSSSNPIGWKNIVSPHKPLYYWFPLVSVDASVQKTRQLSVSPHGVRSGRSFRHSHYKQTGTSGCYRSRFLCKQSPICYGMTRDTSAFKLQGSLFTTTIERNEEVESFKFELHVGFFTIPVSKCLKKPNVRVVQLLLHDMKYQLNEEVLYNVYSLCSV